jgi:hypothetical protein
MTFDGYDIHRIRAVQIKKKMIDFKVKGTTYYALLER